MLFVTYKAYCKFWHCMHRPDSLPPISQPPTAYHGGVVVMSGGSDLPTIHSIRGSGSSPHQPAVSPASTAAWQQQDGFNSTSTSEMPSPSVRGLDSAVLSSNTESSESHARGVSTMTLKRSYLKSSSASQLSYLSNSSRRDSYLPHSPLNRDSIQIVPPQPLGFGGNMAMATDQKTLAFSSNSGVGTAAEDFTSGFLWTDTAGRYLPQRPQVAHQDMQRYLMEGPLSTRTSETPSLLPSSRTSPVIQHTSLSSPSHTQAELPFTKPLSADSLPSDTGGAAPSEQNPSWINSHLLGTDDSPLQRLQSNARQTHPPPRSRLPSEGHGQPSDSDASPILRPFVHQLSRPSTSEGTTSGPGTSSAVAVDETK